jgi:hypothetical protein
VSADPLTGYLQEIRSIPLLQDEKPAAGVTLPLTDNGTITSFLLFRDFKGHLLFAEFGAKRRISARLQIHRERAGFTGLDLAE